MVSRPVLWLKQWINERWPLSAMVRLSLDEEIPGGSSFFYTEGSAILIIFLLQVITGIMQIFFYVPATDHAYNSLSYMRTEVPFGWLIHGMHYWGGNIMIVAVVVHMLRVFLWGAYKTPREVVWLAGVLLLLITMAFSFTGAPLPWDQSGYWAGEVGTSIAGTTPVMGDMVKRLLRGGENMGQLTLSRFFVMHTSVFPLALLAMFGMHFIAFRTSGPVGPWDSVKRRFSGPFWPDQAFKDVVVGTGIFILLIFLSVFFAPDFAGPVDILDTTYVPKPEWNFLFLYQALKYFHGPLEPVGTVGVPTIIMMLLVILPFIDRSPERNPLRRPFVMTCGFIFGATLLALTIIGYYSPGRSESVAGSSAMPGQAEVKPAAPLRPAHDVAVPAVFQSAGCKACHSVEGSGGTIGPSLSKGALAARGQAWIEEQIRNPKAHNPGTIMPAFASLPSRQVDTIVSFLMGSDSGGVTAAGRAASMHLAAQLETQHEAMAKPPASMETESKGLPGEAAYVIGNKERGAVLFKNYCSSCHGPEGTNGIANTGSDAGIVPRLNPVRRELYSGNPKAFAVNIDRYIQHGSVPGGRSPALSMLAFGDTHTLTQQEVANVEAYVMMINGVDRARIINPGMEPRKFFILVSVIYVLVLLVQGGFRIKRNVS
ncbi:MAG: cytochrome b N-terminal domain-containing protein [Nitrospirae bacterium]|nr:cytochrome b N-terminal domain-containing protein [Nitrospirota bacterium]